MPGSAPQPPAPSGSAGVPDGPGAGGAVNRLVVIGCSTGGPPALTAAIPALPAELNAPVIVIQHMPSGFTASLAERLAKLAAAPVREAHDGDILTPGTVLIVPGAQHLSVTAELRVRTSRDAPPMHGVRPAVDFTLRSVPAWLAGRTTVVIRTEMGEDGRQGAQRIHQAGGCVVW